MELKDWLRCPECGSDDCKDKGWSNGDSMVECNDCGEKTFYF